HEVRSGDVPDALRADLLDLRKKAVSEVPGRDAFSRAEQHPLERDTVLLVPRPRADLLLRPLDLRPTRRGATHLVDLPLDRGRDSPDAKEIRPRHPPRTVESKISAGVSSWAADGMCHPMDSKSAGPGRTRSLRRSPRCSGSESRSGSGGASGFNGEKASRTCCIATAGSKPPTRMSEALLGA